MKRLWTDEELEAHFTFHSAALDLVGDSKTDHNLLGFAVLLKYFQCEGRFPSRKQDIPTAVTRHIAHQLGVATEELLILPQNCGSPTLLVLNFSRSRS